MKNNRMMNGMAKAIMVLMALCGLLLAGCSTGGIGGKFGFEPSDAGSAEARMDSGVAVGKVELDPAAKAAMQAMADFKGHLMAYYQQIPAGTPALKRELVVALMTAQGPVLGLESLRHDEGRLFKMVETELTVSHKYVYSHRILGSIEGFGLWPDGLLRKNGYANRTIDSLKAASEDYYDLAKAANTPLVAAQNLSEALRVSVSHGAMALAKDAPAAAQRTSSQVKALAQYYEQKQKFEQENGDLLQRARSGMSEAGGWLGIGERGENLWNRGKELFGW